MYRARLSGPLLDRIDMPVEVPAVTARELLRTPHGDAGSFAGRQRSSSEGPASPAGQEHPSPRHAKPPGRPENGTPPASVSDDSAVTRCRVEVARAIQQRRFVDRLRVRANADMGLAELDAFCRLDLASAALLQKAVESFSLSARAAHRCLRVGRTIADLTGAEEIALEHIAEAVQYQAVERDHPGP
jgi:predicted ATPase with chaperone activity